MRQVGLGIGIQNAKATEDAEGALRAVAADFISNAGEIVVASRLCEACTSTAGMRRATFSSSDASEPGRMPIACKLSYHFASTHCFVGWTARCTCPAASCLLSFAC